MKNLMLSVIVLGSVLFIGCSDTDSDVAAPSTEINKIEYANIGKGKILVEFSLASNNEMDEITFCKNGIIEYSFENGAKKRGTYSIGTDLPVVISIEDNTSATWTISDPTNEFKKDKEFLLKDLGAGANEMVKKISDISIDLVDPNDFCK